MAKNMNAISTVDLTRHDWLMERCNGIGGSDRAAIAGVNKYSSPMKVYLEKTNQIESEEISTVNREDLKTEVRLLILVY
ncbi:YqaJ viral recombinase family protein [Domibacillus tundrae]|uniref:YqaJ viral recombinase family protein n=1 Tax=Domibacillus tundrae TaxID=1587527 RepID=UPI0033946BE7